MLLWWWFIATVAALLPPWPGGKRALQQLYDRTPDSVAGIVARRTAARQRRDFKEADRLKSLLEEKFNVELVDHPYSKGGHTTWSVSDAPNASSHMSVMRIARDFAALVASGKHTEDELIATVVHVLQHEVDGRQNEMQGRKYADAAFEFALAGANNATLFRLLGAGATSELRRYGLRASCRDVDILRVCEKLAAAGLTSRDCDCFTAAAQLLRERARNKDNESWKGIADADVGADDADKEDTAGGVDSGVVADLLASGRFSLLSDRPLLWLWRHSARSRKFGNQCAPLSPVAQGSITLPMFDDPSLPLYVDVGCGLGTSLLGLAADQARQPANYLGCDMSPGAVAFARGIAARWGLGGRCGFAVCAAEDLLVALLDEYPGRVRGVHVQFPTPYSLTAVLHDADSDARGNGDDDDGVSVSVSDSDRNSDRNSDSDSSGDGLSGGNAQLPQDLNDFMVTTPLVALCRRLLAASDSLSSPSEPPGYLLLQSNVEDVAVTMRRTALCREAGPADQGPSFATPTDAECGALFGPGVAPSTGQRPAAAAPLEGGGLPLQKRAQRWVAAGGERAVGAGWFSGRVLPAHARTETEAMLELEKKPVYRTVLVVK